ncbi:MULTISPECIES: hypothetical protein [unclassified Sphingobacterium]|uniref:hypothetical protein n=1 Tax=unclassified Sphingobacterium TaxID=2609468 RepID=UPI0025D67801|nr:MULTISPECIES: hypothetical protein [unclassified Sphingobacterium]
MTAINIKISIEKDHLSIPFNIQDLLQSMDANMKDINDYVVDCLENKDGAPHLSDFSISRLSFYTDHTSGSFRMHFKIDRQFCCSDLLSCQMDYIDFKFNISNDTIAIHGSYVDWTIQ